MHRLTPPRLVMTLWAVFCAPAILFAAPPAERGYRVTVQPGEAVDGARAVAEQMAASYGGTLEADSLAGDAFVVRLSESHARVLSADPRVKSVVPMGGTAAANAVVEVVAWSSGVSFSYDGAGNVKQIGSDRFAYDHVNRLVQATMNGVTRKYEYDAFGNRMGCTQFGQNDCQAFTINTAENKNRIAQASYDAAGNVVAQSNHAYSYDALNMMTRDTYGQLAREFVYTAADERIATYTVGSSWRWTVRDTSGKVLREFSSADAPGGLGTANWKWEKDYVWRDGLLLASRQPDGAGTTTYHYHLDHLGTPRRITDNSDQIVGVHDYFAFGPEASTQVQESSPSSLKYTGHERDGWSTESSDTLDYMHARYYSPWLGRFVSVDRHLGRVESPQSWNRYSYALDNPIRLIDPDGNAPKDSRIIHIRVSVVYSNSDLTAPPLVMRSLRARTEAGLVQARQHYSEMGIALEIRRFEGNVYPDSKGNIGGNVMTSAGPVAITDFIKANVASGGLTLMATPNIDLGPSASSGTKIVRGVPLWTLLSGSAGQKDAEHEMAHSFGNTLGDNQGELANVITDFVWFAERSQHDLFPTTVGFSYWFEQTLREGAAKLEDKNDQ